MGVTGLLPHLKEIQEPVNLNKFRGKSLAVDTYGWLHRGLISCAQELCQDVPTRKYINSVMKKVDMLRHFGIEPYLVFDGSYLPTKAETAMERKLKREEAKANADKYLRLGQKSLAWKEFMKAAGVTPEMAKSIMVELDNKGVKYVVAPYEADPQMVYLEKMGIVDGILSEDSDLLIFGCNRLITKLNDYGDCIEICRENFDKVKSIPLLATYTQSQLRLVAILSGCDYTKGIAGVGIKTAFTLVRRLNNLEKITASLRSDGRAVPLEFEIEAKRADIAFQFQKVFNPQNQLVVSLNEMTEDDNIEFGFLENCCGKTLDAHVHRGICNGKIHPNTLEVLIPREQNIAKLRSSSINEKHSNPVLAGRSKSTPKIGRIDSFFGDRTSSATLLAQPIKVQLAAPSAIGKREVALTKSKDTTGTNLNVSPTTRKIRRVLNQSNASSTDSSSDSSASSTSSKFFDALLSSDTTASTSLSETIKPDWDLSGDSDIDDFSSSPVAHQKHASATKQKLQETKEKIIIDMDEEDEIEESPIKKPLNGVIQSLHERFSMSSTITTTASTTTVTKGHLMNLNSNKPLKPADLGIKIQMKQADVEDEEITDEEEGVFEKVTITKAISLERFAFRG